MSDTFRMSGDFRGAILNIKSTLKNVQQVVGEIHTGDEDAKKELVSLFEKLSNELEKTPVEKKDEAQAVAETAKILVDQAKAPQPNRTLLQITGEGLKAAAKNLAEVIPSILPIATQIVMSIGKMTAGGG